MSFAHRLHALRTAHRLSLQAVADAIGISKAHVWNMEKGITDNPSMELVVKLAGLFRVRVADLVGENPEHADEPAEMVAMFRDLKDLDDRDRDTISMLLGQMKARAKREQQG